jgi:hypothetical protein
MLYAVHVEELNTIFFTTDHPGPGWDVREGIDLDISPNYFRWFGRDKEPEVVLGVSRTDPNRYWVVLHRSDLEYAGYQDTSRSFGGLFSRASWERFAPELKKELAKPVIAIDEPPGATEMALQALRRGR